MNRKRLAGILCLFLLVGLAQAPLLMGDDGIGREKDLTRVRKKVEALRAWQLTEELDLDEKTSSQLFPAMRRADEERWRIEMSNRKLVREMSRSLQDQNPDPDRINRILDELQANRRELIRAEEKHIEQVRQILSPVDTARYLLFQIRFQREIKQKAAEAFRDRRKLDGGPGFGIDDRIMNNPGGDGSDGSGGSSGGGGRGRR